MTRRVFRDHLPYWFVLAATIAFMAFDAWAQINERWIYTPKQETPND